MINTDHPVPPLRSPATAGGGARPRTVTIAALLLAAQAVIGLVGLTVSYALRDAVGETTMSANAIAKQFAEGPTNLSPLGVGCSVLLAGTFLALTAFVLRASDPGRIAARVLSVAGLLLFVAGGLFSVPSPAKPSVPGWYSTYSAVGSLLGLAIAVAIIVLLAPRLSNGYFAKRPD
jgi:hypothetical protein